MPPKAKRPRPTTKRRRRRTSSRKVNTNKFYFWAFVTIAVVIGVVQVTSQIRNPTEALSSFDIPETASVAGTYWWDPNYSHRRRLETASTNSNTLLYRFDHQSLVSDSKSLKNGADIKLVAQLDNIADEVAYEINKLDTPGSGLVFDTSKYPHAEYYLYYGNPYPQTSKVLGTTKLSINNSESVFAGMAETPFIGLQTESKWAIKYKAGTEVSLLLNVNLPDPSKKISSSFIILNDEMETIQDINTQTGDGKVLLDLADIQAGEHKLFIVYEIAGEFYRSNSVRFTVSAPLYVAITIDWEGRNGEADWVLKELTELSDKYEIPYTHFFNPRIFINDQIQEYRVNQLTQWVRGRSVRNGDEIALHLHMFYDVVRAAGVSPLETPRWGLGLDGYDVLASGYSHEDFTKILNWSIRQFKLHDLPTPKGFRAGGWFASGETLRAINDAGFKYDSSGRDKYKFGSQEKKGHWDLPYNRTPYHPSLADQNIEGTNEFLRLLEVPNNGNDSYWHTLKELKDRFYANYNPGEYLTEPRMVTYLTHPDWFETDKPRLKQLIKEIDQFALRNNSGPVIYTTIEDTLEEWE